MNTNGVQSDEPAEEKGQTVAVIVAGGRARRMGEGDKTLRSLVGRPMVIHVWAAIAPQVVRVALNGNGRPERFSTILPDVPVLADAEPDQGPLAGVLAGLRWAVEEGVKRLLTVPGDTPFLPEDLVVRLTRTAVAAGTRVACASAGGRWHPLVSVWDVALAVPLAAFLAGGGRTVRQFVEVCRPAVADFPLMPFDPFLNVNTPDDLAAAEQMARERQRLPEDSPPCRFW